MTDPVIRARAPRGKGLRSRAAKRRKALLFRSSLAPIEVPHDKGPRR